MWKHALMLCLLVAVVKVHCKKWFRPVGKLNNDDGGFGGATFGSSQRNKIWKVDELSRKSKTDIMKFLGAYGYTDRYRGIDDDPDELTEGIKDLQFFAGIPTTGMLDAATVEMINTDRCGIKDPDPRRKRKESERKGLTGRSRRIRRFTHQGTKWKKSQLTWQYLHDPWQRNNHLSEDRVRDVMKTAMKKWSDATNIEFVEDRNPFTVGGKDNPDILIRFVSSSVSVRHHKIDPYPFDGQGGTLAHAFYPLDNVGLAGDVHFDDDEDYTDGKPKYGQVDMNWVAVHELGHSLGLEHSHTQKAIMYPYYSGWKKWKANIGLTDDDRAGIQTIYGGKIRKKKEEEKKVEKKEEKNRKEKPTINPMVVKPVVKEKKCPTSPVTAVYQYGREQFRILTKNEVMYEVAQDGVTSNNSPKASLYDDIPDTIDSVYQTNFGRRGGKYYEVLFTRGGYYVYRGKSRESGPHSYIGGTSNCNGKKSNDNRPLKINFPSYITNIDAVMKWQKDDKVYFFSGSAFWKYDERTELMECNPGGYPNPISETWKGVPDNIDAAHSTVNGKTFFIRGDRIYYFDDTREVRVGSWKGESVREDFLRC